MGGDDDRGDAEKCGWTNECGTPSHAGRRVGSDLDGDEGARAAAEVTGDRTREKSRREVKNTQIRTALLESLQNGEAWKR